jgi:hypothetical protein
VPDTDEAFYFDAPTGLNEGEYPILRFDYNDGSSTHFADSFALFIETLVRPT